MKTYAPKDWLELSKDLYDLIVADIENTSFDALPIVYPKLVVMYEFFRFLRGEAFSAARPSGMGEFQREMYKMENDLSVRLKQLEKTLNIKDSRTSFHLDLMKKSFSLKYFNHE